MLKMGPVLPIRSRDYAFADRDPRLRAQCHKTKLCVFFPKGACLKGEACHFAHGSKELAVETDLRKTSLCQRWCRNACLFDSKECPYAHGAAELRMTAAYRDSGPGRQAHEQKGNLEGRDLGRRALTYSQTRSAAAGGMEPSGDNLQRRLLSTVGSPGARAEAKQGASEIAATSPSLRCGPSRNDPRFRLQCRKTKLCSYFISGSCLKGDACNFAHGANDLEAPPNLTKTSLCRRWLRSVCSLSRAECPYAHGLGELRSTELLCDPDDTAEQSNDNMAASADVRVAPVPSRAAADPSPMRSSPDGPRRPTSTPRDSSGCEYPMMAAASYVEEVGQLGAGSRAEKAQWQAASSIDELTGMKLPQMQEPPQAAPRSVTYIILPVAVHACTVPITPTPLATSVQVDELLRQAMPDHYED